MIEPNTSPEEHLNSDEPSDSAEPDESVGADDEENLLPTWIFEIMRPLMIAPVESELADADPVDAAAADETD